VFAARIGHAVFIAMKSLESHLTTYARYHRDRRNIATHFVGIPMIVLGVTSLLSRPQFALSGVTLSPAVFVTLGATLFYLLLDRRFGLTMALLLGVSLSAGHWVGAQSLATWLGGSLGLFFVGWVIQFIGHYFEGKKPAFVDDLVGLLVGPLFVVAEVAFALGLRAEVERAITAKAGPLRSARPSKVAS